MRTTTLRARCAITMAGVLAMLGCEGAITMASSTDAGPTMPRSDGASPTMPRDGSMPSACGDVPELAPLFEGAHPPDERPLHWTTDDGALVTRGAGRVRGRHENEAEFSVFHPLYFENRTFEFLIEDTIPAGGTTLRITWLPEVRNRGPNLRAFYTGEGNVFHHNVNMVERDLGDGRFAYEYVIERNYGTGAPLAIGDRVELEFGVFLTTEIEGRTNYYTDTYRYVVGTPGLHPLAERGDDVLSGGAATIPAIVVEPELSFFQYALDLPIEWLGPALEGRRRFHTDFTVGAHTEALGPVLPELVGLAGPRVNEVSCIGCHVRDGRGRVPESGATELGGSVLRLASATDPTRPDERLGGQLQDRALAGAPEASFTVEWIASAGSYGDGTAYELVRPAFRIGVDGAQPRISPRIAPPVVGLGLLEAIEDETIVALADELDCNGDGISGRVSVVVDPADGRTRLGRFGWRASKASLVHQTAGALANDMGVTTSMFASVDCGSAQAGCGEGGVELRDEDLELIATYLRGLGVPPRRGVDDPAVQRGAVLFGEAGCASCHVPALRTGSSHPVIALRDQTIRPYTDLLLHDMGEGLADEVEGEGVATGREWRTPPLWGIGLTEIVSGETRFLHDGRARSFAEAILWHGGEAEGAREAFRTMSAEDRAALAAYLGSL